jgi:hypothetical protein
MWSVPELNNEYVTRMEDVLETYEKPYNPQEPVVCLDEKPVTLHADVRPASPAQPGREARQDSEYERRGTANVFCAVEPKAGRHFTFATPDRSGFEFAQVACQLAMQYSQADTIHLGSAGEFQKRAVVCPFGVRGVSRAGPRSCGTARDANRPPCPAVRRRGHRACRSRGGGD